MEAPTFLLNSVVFNISQDSVTIGCGLDISGVSLIP